MNTGIRRLVLSVVNAYYRFITLSPGRNFEISSKIFSTIGQKRKCPDGKPTDRSFRVAAAEPVFVSTFGAKIHEWKVQQSNFKETLAWADSIDP